MRLRRAVFIRGQSPLTVAGGRAVPARGWRGIPASERNGNRIGRSRDLSNLSIEVADDLAGILGKVQQPIGSAALELIVLELYRRGKVSSGRGAELLGMSRLGFIQHASGLGKPYLRLDDHELQRDMELRRSL